jgi:hypothetical protein
MTCYAVPLTAAALIFGGRKILHKTDEKSFRFCQMMAGGAIFGVVDHAWNGELFLFGPNLLADLALGVAITGFITLAWFASEALMFAQKSVETKTAKG